MIRVQVDTTYIQNRSRTEVAVTKKKGLLLYNKNKEILVRREGAMSAALKESCRNPQVQKVEMV